MNYLAHIYLSGADELLTIGNFIADGIKGKQYQTYPPDIQKGILLHRAIDTYTDAHPIVRQSTKKLHAVHGHYSGVIVDMLYDHFLAKHWEQFHPTPLDVYAADFYKSLQEHEALLPPRILRLMPPMLQYNWLVMYASIEGIDTILKQMHHKTKFRGALDIAGDSLLAHYDAFETEFFAFFTELQAFVADML
ncbi:Acyl carrier protein phosphodiesterase [Pustulibacterium marinum]|uniref:Acyl carrier protein phosphodiesterase n=1 Tax=Pustulibacterium marinum TaxID=1224947 RepID=A0A1I7ICS5_9FLAO|nr:ACP phosphodiesterase [Pustulibacterium marinum]SFU70744.1 Acyl carrier protein phosphodiesterase [Pustulibacterium marinum]